MTKHKGLAMKKTNVSVIENFLSVSEAQELERDYEKFAGAELSVMHGGRAYMPNTDEDFLKLTKSSTAWKSFYKKLNSSDFFDLCNKELGLSTC